MTAEELKWEDLLEELGNSPKVQQLIQRASRDFMEGREDARGLAEIIGALAGDV